ncbi:MAG TPA: dephospho-CoA kinase, partial [Thermodesulfovibrionales bacterium]|nr:dephospho-CoA kinase [Thermodesulfovibrionales bacterium]
MLIVGLTGNYGMGKSTVLRMFRKLGAVTLETDEIVDTLLHDETVLVRIRKVFGETVIAQDGSLDRARIAAVVFRNRELREGLEGIIHPLVFEKIRDILEEMKERDGDEKVVIVEIPLLFEKGYAGQFQKTVTVFTSVEAALKRLEDAGVGREDSLLRLETQMPAHEKVRKSDFAIDNGGPLDET